MADRNSKYKDNIPGVYYVDKKCISCAACVGVANHFFKMDYDNQHAVVKKQPSTPDEAKICIQALERCPVNAIGNDGYLSLKLVKDLNINISYNLLPTKQLTNKITKTNLFLFNFLIIIFNIFIFNLPSQAIAHKQISVRFVKPIEKPRIIFYSNDKNEKKISYPHKVIYSVNDYFSNPFTTTTGLPASYQMLLGNRYVIYQNYYASGGSGSMANLYMLDLQVPRVWHLAMAETIGGDYPEYILSSDKRKMLFYQNKFYSPLIFMAMNKKNSPYISEVITKLQLEKLLSKTFRKKYEVFNANAEWKNNNFEITISSNISNEKNNKTEYHKLIFDINKNKITSISNIIEKRLSYDWKKLHMDENQFDYEKENILSTDKKLVKIYFYKDSGSSPVKRQYFLQILRMSDYRVIYECTKTKDINKDLDRDDSNIFYFSWLNKHIALLNILGEDTYTLNINDSTNKVDSIKNNELEYLSSDNLSPDAKFALYLKLKNPNNEKEGEILKLIRMKDNKTIFSAEIFNITYPAISFQWINNNQAIYFDKSGYLHILKISSNGESIEDSLVKNFPMLSNKEKINHNILSNNVNSAICIVSDNNLYWIDLNKLEAVKITDFHFKFKYSKYGDVEFSDLRPQVSLPYITIDGKRIFYGLLPNDYNAKLMSLKLKN